MEKKDGIPIFYMKIDVVFPFEKVMNANLTY